LGCRAAHRFHSPRTDTPAVIESPIRRIFGKRFERRMKKWEAISTKLPSMQDNACQKND